MYIAYSKTNDNLEGHKSLPTKYSNFTKSVENKFTAKKLYRLMAVVLVLSLIFSFGAFVQVYAGNGDSVKIDNHAVVQPLSATAIHAPIKVVVNRGDTLWEIASEHISQSRNIRSYIAQIKQLNGLSSSVLQEGDVLILPE
jgi:LysM repeat protein